MAKMAPKKTPGRSSTARKPTRCWAIRTFSTVRREVSTTNAVWSRAPWENCGPIVVHPINWQPASASNGFKMSRIDVHRQPLSCPPLSFPFLRFLLLPILCFGHSQVTSFTFSLLFAPSKLLVFLSKTTFIWSISALPSQQSRVTCSTIFPLNFVPEIWLSFRHVVENVRLSIFVLGLWWCGHWSQPSRFVLLLVSLNSSKDTSQHCWPNDEMPNNQVTIYSLKYFCLLIPYLPAIAHLAEDNTA